MFPRVPTDEPEFFQVELGLDDHARIVVGNFRGKKSRITGLSWSMMDWDEFLDFRGDQEETALRLVESMAALLEVPIGGPFCSRGEDTLRCVRCRRAALPLSVTSTDRCDVCGGGLIGKRF